MAGPTKEKRHSQFFSAEVVAVAWLGSKHSDFESQEKEIKEKLGHAMLENNISCHFSLKIRTVPS